MLLALWLGLAVVVGIAAAQRGRSGIGWSALAVLISPLIAGLVMAILPDLRTRGLIEGLHRGVPVDDAALERQVRQEARRERQRQKLS